MPSLPPRDETGVKPQSIVRKGKDAYRQQVQENGGNKSAASLAPLAGCIRVRAPEITVERADASVEPSKRGRPKKLVEAKIVKPSTVLENERQVIIREEAQTEVMEEPDILADQRAMQCPDWAPRKTLTLLLSD